MIVQFVWPQDDEGDYLAYRTMTDAECAEVEVLLTKAEDLGLIRSGWYVGPLGMSNDSHEAFMKALSDDLNIDGCLCVPTLNEVHPNCPVHGEA